MAVKCKVFVLRIFLKTFICKSKPMTVSENYVSLLKPSSLIIQQKYRIE